MPRPYGLFRRERLEHGREMLHALRQNHEQGSSEGSTMIRHLSACSGAGARVRDRRGGPGDHVRAHDGSHGAGRLARHPLQECLPADAEDDRRPPREGDHVRRQDRRHRSGKECAQAHHRGQRRCGDGFGVGTVNDAGSANRKRVEGALDSALARGASPRQAGMGVRGPAAHAADDERRGRAHEGSRREDAWATSGFPIPGATSS